MKRKPKVSEAYEQGRQRARAAVYQTGRLGIAPSMTDRREYGYIWNIFMQGWFQGKKEMRR